MDGVSIIIYPTRYYELKLLCMEIDFDQGYKFSTVRKVCTFNLLYSLFDFFGFFFHCDSVKNNRRDFNRIVAKYIIYIMPF